MLQLQDLAQQALNNLNLSNDLRPFFSHIQRCDYSAAYQFLIEREDKEAKNWIFSDPILSEIGTILQDWKKIQFAAYENTIFYQNHIAPYLQTANPVFLLGTPFLSLAGIEKKNPSTRELLDFLQIQEELLHSHKNASIVTQEWFNSFRIALHREADIISIPYYSGIREQLLGLIPTADFTFAKLINAILLMQEQKNVAPIKGTHIVTACAHSGEIAQFLWVLTNAKYRKQAQNDFYAFSSSSLPYPHDLHTFKNMRWLFNIFLKTAIINHDNTDALYTFAIENRSIPQLEWLWGHYPTQESRQKAIFKDERYPIFGSACDKDYGDIVQWFIEKLEPANFEKVLHLKAYIKVPNHIAYSDEQIDYGMLYSACMDGSLKTAQLLWDYYSPQDQQDFLRYRGHGDTQRWPHILVTYLDDNNPQKKPLLRWLTSCYSNENLIAAFCDIFVPKHGINIQDYRYRLYFEYLIVEWIYRRHLPLDESIAQLCEALNDHMINLGDHFSPEDRKRTLQKLDEAINSDPFRRLIINTHEQLAGEFLATMVFICDDFFKIKDKTQVPEHQTGAVSYWQIAQKLSLDLQSVLTWRTIGSPRDTIKPEICEEGFKSVSGKMRR